MSNPNRNKVLLGFGAVAVIVIAAVAFWPANFRSEEASGAIGVVQKHHAPQIAQHDVILGSEQTRAQQNVLYRDFFKHASKLQSISAAMASREDGAAIAQNAEELANQLANDYSAEMQSALAGAELQAKASGNTQLMVQEEALASQVKAATKLSAEQMQEFNAQFANIEQAAAKTASAMELANAQLQSALANEGEAASHLKTAEQEMASVNLASVSLSAQQEYFSEMEAASRSLRQVEFANTNMATRMQSAQLLAKTASKLESAALHNIEMQSAAQIEMASAIAQMQAQLASAHVAGNAVFANFETQLSSMKQNFAQYASASIQAELASMQEFAASAAQYGSQKLEASMAGNSAQVENAALFHQLANTEEVANVAANVERALQNQALASALANEADLAQQAEALASRKQ